MKARRLVTALVMAFFLSVVFGMLLSWTDVLALWRGFVRPQKEVVWLEPQSPSVSGGALTSPLHFVSLPQNLEDYRDLGSENIQALASSGNLIVAATRGGGVSLSVDNARSWYTATTSNGLPSNFAFSAFVEGERIYVGTENGVAWSDTMGRRWNSRNSGNSNLGDNGKVVSLYARDQVIFAGTAGAGLKISRDAGKTWVSASEKGLDAGYVVSIAATEKEVFAATERGIFVSRDGGESWPHQIMGGESGLGSHRILTLAVCGSHLYAGTQQGLFKSSDLTGSDWTELSFSGWPPHTGVMSVSAFLHEGAADCTVAVGLSGAGVGLSQNAGAGWVFLGAQRGLEAENIFSVVATNEGVLAGGAGTGVIAVNKNGIDWKRTEAPRVISAPPVASVATRGAEIFVTTRQGLVVSQNGGSSWQSKPLGGSEESSVPKVFVAEEKVLVVSGRGLCEYFGIHADWVCKSPQEFGFSQADGALTGFSQTGALAIVASENGGVAISKKGMRGPWQLKSAADIGNLKVNDVLAWKGSLYAVTDSTLAVSDDGGETWRKITFGEYRALGLAVEGKTLAVALKGGGIALSKDGGTAWSFLRAAQGLVDNTVNAIAFSKGVLFAATPKGLSISYDFGRSWHTSTVSNGLGSNNVTSLAIVGNSVFAGTDVGLSFVDMKIQN
jgi:hypothetical protein